MKRRKARLASEMGNLRTKAEFYKNQKDQDRKAINQAEEQVARVYKEWQQQAGFAGLD